MIDCPIKGLKLDSRKVCPGDVFVALKGHTQNGLKYIPEAIQKGAVAVLSEAGNPEHLLNAKCHVPIIKYSYLREALGFMASRFFLDPSHTLPVIGITGTNGKTSCAHFIAQLLNAWSKRCGFMGTLGLGFVSELQPSTCTTPDVISVHRQLADFRSQGAFSVAMEVSSHALQQKRVNGVRFKVVIFSNFTQDHLDYHHDMDAYWEAKKRLFTDYDFQYAIINLDDPKAEELVSILLQRQTIPPNNIIGYTTTEVSRLNKPVFKDIRWIHTTAFSLDKHGISASIETPWGNGHFSCSLLGQFNLSNILAALSAVCIQGMPFEQVLKAIHHLKTVPGRMMCIGGGKVPLVVVDYAHTPDALKQVLSALRSHCRAKLWCVFGCGGDRDRIKRPLMASVAETLSDRVWLTLDNPRTESHQQIFEDMLQGIKKPDAITVLPNRVMAIKKAILEADPLDIVLIAGKGHETLQNMGTYVEPLDDYQEAITALQGREL